MKIDYAEIERMYHAGLSDCAITANVGCSDSTVRGWRYREGLPFNGGGTAPKGKEPPCNIIAHAAWLEAVRPHLPPVRQRLLAMLRTGRAFSD